MLENTNINNYYNRNTIKKNRSFNNEIGFASAPLSSNFSAPESDQVEISSKTQERKNLTKNQKIIIGASAIGLTGVLSTAGFLAAVKTGKIKSSWKWLNKMLGVNFKGSEDLIIRLQKEQKEVKENFSNVNEKNQKLLKKLQEQSEQIEQFKTENQKLNTKVSTLKKDFKTKIDSLKQEKQETQKTLENLQSEAQNLQAKIDSLEQEKQETQETLENLQSEAQNLQVKIDSLKYKKQEILKTEREKTKQINKLKNILMQDSDYEKYTIATTINDITQSSQASLKQLYDWVELLNKYKNMYLAYLNCLPTYLEDPNLDFNHYKNMLQVRFTAFEMSLLNQKILKQNHDKKKEIEVIKQFLAPDGEHASYNNYLKLINKNIGLEFMTYEEAPFFNALYNIENKNETDYFFILQQVDNFAKNYETNINDEIYSVNNVFISFKENDALDKQKFLENSKKIYDFFEQEGLLNIVPINPQESDTPITDIQDIINNIIKNFENKPTNYALSSDPHKSLSCKDLIDLKQNLENDKSNTIEVPHLVKAQPLETIEIEEDIYSENSSLDKQTFEELIIYKSV